MGDTGMVPDSGTRGRSSGKEEKVALYEKGREPVITDHTTNRGPVYAVRVTKGDERVLLHIDTKRQAERDKFRAANESIRRRTRG
jgi:hypothetical protein